MGLCCSSDLCWWRFGVTMSAKQSILPSGLWNKDSDSLVLPFF